MNPGHVDGSIHLISEKSVDDLRRRVNEHSDVVVEPYQFKPNIVVEGVEAYEEDHMKQMVIGDDNTVSLTITKPCMRCKNTAYIYNKGKFDSYMEPFTTLREYRQRGPKGDAPFGMYASADTEGYINVGDTVRYS